MSDLKLSQLYHLTAGLLICLDANEMPGNVSHSVGRQAMKKLITLHADLKKLKEKTGKPL